MNINGVEYILLAEYAERAGVDPANVRQKLARGTIEGVKVGHNWMVKADTPIMVDNRVKSGKYRGWRNKGKAE